MNYHDSYPLCSCSRKHPVLLCCAYPVHYSPFVRAALSPLLHGPNSYAPAHSCHCASLRLLMVAIMITCTLCLQPVTFSTPPVICFPDLDFCRTCRSLQTLRRRKVPRRRVLQGKMFRKSVNLQSRVTNQKKIRVAPKNVVVATTKYPVTTSTVSPNQFRPLQDSMSETACSAE